MPSATVRANARAMPIDRRQFLASGTAAAVFAALHATAHAMPAPLGARKFDPAAYVAMWEDCGNDVYWVVEADGNERFSIYFPRAGMMPDFAAIRAFNGIAESEDECTAMVVDYLKVRDQKAAWAPSAEVGR